LGFLQKRSEIDQDFSGRSSQVNLSWTQKE
jgi:hypothetical protein